MHACKNLCHAYVITSIQCAAPFVGDGKVCGRDSDGDGYPDMVLNCNDTYCVQVCCYSTHFMISRNMVQH